MDSYKSPKFILALLSVLAVTAIVIVSVATKNTQPFQNQFSVAAEGKVFAKPDIANIRLGVKTEVKKTAAEAVEENAKKMNAVVEKLKGMDIEAKDIKTTSYNLNPEYDYNNYPMMIEGQASIVPVPPVGPKLLGYSLYQEVLVKIRNLDTLGGVIEGAAEVGSNQVGDIMFTIDDTDALKAQAREEAIAKAKAKAGSIANLSGIELGDLINVYESDQYPGPMYGIGGMRADMAMEAKVAPELQPGQNEIVVNVTMTWEVED